MSFRDNDVRKEPKTKRQLIKKVLEVATPVQLLAVRAYLQRFDSAYGYDSIIDQKKRAIKAFDRGEYGNANISYLVREEELAIIVQHPERAKEFAR